MARARAVGDKGCGSALAEPQGKNSGVTAIAASRIGRSANSNSSGTVDGSFADLAVKAGKAEFSGCSNRRYSARFGMLRLQRRRKLAWPAMSGLRVQGNGDGATMQAPSAIDDNPMPVRTGVCRTTVTTKGVSTAQLARCSVAHRDAHCDANGQNSATLSCERT